MYVLSLCVLRVFRAFEIGRSSSYSFLLMNDTYDFKSCVALHVRIANQLVRTVVVEEVLYTFGVVVLVRFSIRRPRPKALWRFRASTSNSLSGRSRLHLTRQLRYIYHTCAQQGIRVCGDDHFQPPNWQYPNPKALSLLRVSI